METDADLGVRVVREREPFNAETPLPLLGEALTPLPSFYVRNHFPMPDLTVNAWQLAVDGAVEQPLGLSLEQLRELPQQTVRVTLECAGNGRTRMARRAKGTQWEYGATGTAEFTGTPLRPLFERARLRPGVVEILCGGADRGQMPQGREGSFERGLPLAVALAPETLLAWAMNGEALPREHGFPLRLVVPGWYGMASVKWLVRLRALTAPFEGYYQKEQYVYTGEPGVPDGTPVTEMRVRSVIARPADGAVLPLGQTEIAGSAWSGAGRVDRVEVSLDEGRSWTPAELSDSRPGAAATWRLLWTPAHPGALTIMAQAVDSAGNAQPLEPRWNKQGYGNNAVQSVQVVVGNDTV